jgi:hypothetical protein
MHRYVKAVLVVVIAALLGTVGLVSFASASSNTSATKTIHVVQPATAKFTNVDVGDEDESPGDYVVITSPLVKPGTDKKVGSVAAVCTLVKVTPTFPSQCVGTASLSRGDITVQGIFLSVEGKRNVLAITGGTGAYRTAHGTLTATILRSGATDLVFKLIL